MKGLIYKDIYSLRQQLSFFVKLCIGCAVVGIMYVLSAKYGNVALAIRESGTSDSAPEEILLFSKISSLVMYLIIGTPIALAEQVSFCFKDDYKSSFGKVFFALPISDKQKVGSRFITAGLFIGIAAMFSVTLSFIISVIFKAGVINNFLTVIYYEICEITIFISILLFGGFVLGGKRIDMVSTIIFGTLLFAFMAYEVFIIINGDETMGDAELLLTLLDKIKIFLLNPITFICAFVISAACVLACFFGSIKMLGRRKGTL